MYCITLFLLMNLHEGDDSPISSIPSIHAQMLEDVVIRVFPQVIFSNCNLHLNLMPETAILKSTGIISFNTNICNIAGHVVHTVNTPYERLNFILLQTYVRRVIKQDSSEYFNIITNFLRINSFSCGINITYVVFFSNTLIGRNCHSILCIDFITF